MKLDELTDVVLWWPLMLVEKIGNGPLKFIATIAVLPLCLICIPMAIPLMFLTAIVDIWDDTIE